MSASHEDFVYQALALDLSLLESAVTSGQSQTIVRCGVTRVSQFIPQGLSDCGAMKDEAAAQILQMMWLSRNYAVFQNVSGMMPCHVYGFPQFTDHLGFWSQFPWSPYGDAIRPDWRRAVAVPLSTLRHQSRRRGHHPGALLCCHFLVQLQRHALIVAVCRLTNPCQLLYATVRSQSAVLHLVALEAAASCFGSYPISHAPLTRVHQIIRSQPTSQWSPS